MAKSNTFAHVIEATDLADLASIHVAAHQDGTICWVDSQQEPYYLSSSSSLPVDGTTVVAPAPGARVGKPSAVWIALSALPDLPFFVVSPLGGGQDDAPQLSAAYNANAGVRPVVLSSGHYIWGSAHQLPPNNLVVIAMPGTVIEATTPTDLTEHSSPFNYNINETLTTITTVVGGTPPIGTNVFTVADASSDDLAPGKYVRLDLGGTDSRIADYLIVARNVGAGTITVERPILFTFPAGALVRTCIPIQHFYLYGNGLRITTQTGCTKAIDVLDAWYCYACDVTVDGNWPQMAVDWNEGSFASGFERFTVDCENVAQAGIGSELSEGCWVNHAQVRRGVIAGILFEATVLSTVYGCQCFENQNGLLAVSPTATETEGCRWLKIYDSSFNANVLQGIVISDDAEDTLIDGVQASYNGQYGIVIEPFNIANPPQRTVMGMIECSGNGTAGVAVVSAGSVGNRISDLTATGNPRTSVIGAGSELVDGTPTLDPTFRNVTIEPTGGIAYPGGSGVRVTGFLVTQIGTGANAAFGAGAMLVVSGPMVGLVGGATSGFVMIKAVPTDPAGVVGQPIDPGVGVAWGCERTSAPDTVEFRVWNTGAAPTALAAVTWDIWAYQFAV